MFRNNSVIFILSDGMRTVQYVKCGKGYNKKYLCPENAEDIEAACLAGQADSCYGIGEHKDK